MIQNAVVNLNKSSQWQSIKNCILSHYVSYSLGKCTSTASASLWFFLNSWDQKVIRHIILSLHTAHCSLPHSLKFHAEKGQGRASLSFPPSSSPDGRWDIELRLALVCPWGLGRRDQQLMVMQCTVISEGIQFSSKFVGVFSPQKWKNLHIHDLLLQRTNMKEISNHFLYTVWL